MPEIQSSPRPYRVKLSVDPASGERWALVEGPDGIAHYGTTLYGVDCLRGRGLSHNTQLFALGAVAIALNWAARRGVDLEARIASCEFLSRGEAFDLKQALRRNGNRDKVKDKKTVGLVPAVVAPATWVTRVRDVCAYLVWHAEDVVRRIPNRDDIRARDAGARIDDLKRILLDDLPAAKSGGRKSMGEDGRAAFLEAIRPDGPSNPFKPPYRRRNWLLLRLLDETGCRRGEVLGVTGVDLLLLQDEPKVLVGVRRTADDKLDSRRQKPLPKTLQRQSPITKELAADLMDYMKNERTSIPNAKRSPFVFLARDGKPLSLQAVNDMYRLLRSRAPGVPGHSSPHVSRHDWNERFSDFAEAAGMSEAEEQQARNYNMGWAKGSPQGEAYQKRRTVRKANAAALRMQEKSWKGGEK